MPDPDTTNRERLLRLIDGGTEALKEFQAEEAPAVKKAPALPGITAASLARLIEIGRLLLILGAILAALHYGLAAVRALKAPGKTDVPALGAAPDDESGIGLRLVGVDSSGPPVALLEDLNTGKTYFARVNEQVKDVRVKHIEKNKVLVWARGKTVELR